MTTRPLGNLDLRHHHVRALAAFARFLPGPLVFEPSPARYIGWPGIVAQQAGLFVVAKDPAMRLPLHVLEHAVLASQMDAIRIVLNQPDATTPLTYDLVFQNRGATETMKDYLLHLSDDGTATFVPERAGDAVRLGSAGLISTCAMPFASQVERMQGIGRALVAMSMTVWGREYRKLPC